VTYRAVPGSALRTRWDDEPSVVVINHRDQGGVVELSWATEPARSGWVPGRTRATFTGVVEYRWRYFDVDADSGEEGALELGEITDSRRVAALRGQGFDSDLRHYLVSFDEHGRYDVICSGLRVEYRAGSSTGSPERAWTGSPGSEGNGERST
jgi:hypothetical protein